MILFGTLLKTNSEERKRIPIWLIIIIAVVVIAAVFVILLLSRQSTYHITEGDSTVVHLSKAADLNEVFAEAGIVLDENDRYAVTEQDDGAHIEIIRGLAITIRSGDDVTQTVAYGGTVGDLLKQEGIEYPGIDHANYAIDTPLNDGMVIAMDAVEYRYATVSAPVRHGTKQVLTDSMLVGQQRLISDGIDGAQIITYRNKFVNGMFESSQPIDSEIVTAPVDAVVEYGTRDHYYLADGPITLPEKYLYTLNLTATAYTTELQVNTITASGAEARVGIVAVDPKQIPLGSELFITSADGSWVYGYAIAGDTGDLGTYVIDLFFDYHATCVEFGARDAIVYVISEPEDE